MISARVVRADETSTTARVEVFVDQELFTTTPFKSHGLAEAYLVHNGYVRITGPSGDWYPNWPSTQYTAVPMIGAQAYSSTPLKEDDGPLLICGEPLMVHVVQVPRGLGFRFGIRRKAVEPLTGQTGAVGDFVDATHTDPIVNILTTGLFDVQAIGTWPTEESTRRAGEVFFKRVKALVGSPELLYKLLELEKEC